MVDLNWLWLKLGLGEAVQNEGKSEHCANDLINKAELLCICIRLNKCVSHAVRPPMCLIKRGRDIKA